MKKSVNLLKKVGQSMTELSVMAPCIPLMAYQPKAPAKIQKKILENK